MRVTQIDQIKIGKMRGINKTIYKMFVAKKLRLGKLKRFTIYSVGVAQIDQIKIGKMMGINKTSIKCSFRIN